VPVIAYENLGPVDAFKRSANMMRQKWGERIGAGFSFGLLSFLGFLIFGIGFFLIGMVFSPIAAVILAVLGILLVSAIVSAAKTIFISAVYHNINGDPIDHFNQQMIDNLFVQK
jgi:TM2 domain-containing membrane protein YozV